MGRLHNHRAFEAETPLQLQILGQRRIRWLSHRSRRLLVFLAEDMNVAVASAGRQAAANFWGHGQGFRSIRLRMRVALSALTAPTGKRPARMASTWRTVSMD